MVRKILFLMLVCLGVSAGCSRGEGEAASPVASTPDSVRSESWRESYSQTGQEVYEHACASCHEEGLDGAPVLGDPEAWTPRSDLWTAVLSGHAKAGYLAMPEKGGHSELTDEQVSAAVEYMMQKTFPEKPRD
jgi:cytochrome c5